MKIQLKHSNGLTTLRDIKFGETFRHEGCTWIRIYNAVHDENLCNTGSVVNLTTGVEEERSWDIVVEPISGTFVENGAESENTDTANIDELLDLRERVAMLRETVQNYKDTNSELEKQNNEYLSWLTQITDIVYSDVDHISAEIIVLRLDELLDKIKTAVTLSKQSKTVLEDTQIAELEQRIKSLSDSLSDFQSSNAVNLTRAEEYSQKLGECQFINAKLREEKEKLVLEMAEINKKLQICENANEHLRDELNAQSNNCVPLVGLNAVFDFTEETIKKINDILSPIDRSLDDWEITTVGSLLQMVVSVAVDLRKLTANLSNENSTKTLSTDDITELEKQLFTAGIDIKLHIGNEINIIKQLVKTIVEQEKSYLKLLHNASKLPIELQRNLSTLLSDAGINDIDLDNPNTASLISTLVHSYVTDHMICRNLLDKCRAFADSVLEAEEPILDYSDDDLDEPTD